MIKTLREGVHVNHYFKGFTRYEPICSSSVLIQSEGINILVDPGHIALAKELEQLLAKDGLTPKDIDFVFITHHHLDHASNMGGFPKAKIFIGDGFVEREKPTYITYQYLSLFQLPKGFSIIPTPGHTTESMSFLFEENGLKYVCAGDAIREDVIRDQAPIAMYSREIFFESVRKIFELADVIIPGHGRVIEGENLRELKEMVRPSTGSG